MPLDVIIIGAGPAGTTAARLLHGWGHSVALVTDRVTQAKWRAESLPPSIRRLFQLLEILPQIDRQDFSRCLGNVAWWGSAEPQVETFTEELGYHLIRAEFDIQLANLYSGGIYTGTVRSVDDAGTVRLADGRSLEAQFILDCSGRTGVIARRGLRQYEPYRTVALCATWLSTRSEYPGYTLLESYADGWAWSVPVSQEKRQITVMVDYEATNLERGQGHIQLYRNELKKTTAFAKLVEAKEIFGTVQGTDASTYTSSQFAGDRWLLVGDAGSFIDPLSSYGVRKAMASAWLAAVVIHTALVDSGRRRLAFDYFDERERQLYANFQRRTAQFFVEHGPSEDFYQRRSISNDAPFYRQADVMEVWDSLRRTPSIHLQTSDQLSYETRAGIQENEIVPRRTLAAPGIPPGLQFVHGVDLALLVEMAPQFHQIPDLFEAYNRASVPVDLPNFVTVLAILISNGILRTSTID